MGYGRKELSSLAKRWCIGCTAEALAQVGRTAWAYAVAHQSILLCAAVATHAAATHILLPRLLTESYEATVALAGDMDKAAKGFVDLTTIADNLFTSWLADYPTEELEWMEQKYGEEVGGWRWRSCCWAAMSQLGCMLHWWIAAGTEVQREVLGGMVVALPGHSSCTVCVPGCWPADAPPVTCS
jgi:hypothetical protein